MSWSLKVIGSRAGVRARIEASPSIPDGIKAAIYEALDSADPEKLGFVVETNGHRQAGYLGVGRIDVSAADVAFDPAVDSVGQPIVTTPPPPAPAAPLT